MLINRREKVGIRKLKNPKAFIDYPRTIDYLYENLEDCNPTRKSNVLIVFDDMIADMKANFNSYCPIVLLFLKGRKHFNYIVFKSQFYFKVPQTIRLNTTRYFVMKTPTKREFEQIASNHW